MAQVLLRLMLRMTAADKTPAEITDHRAASAAADAADWPRVAYTANSSTNVAMKAWTKRLQMNL